MQGKPGGGIGVAQTPGKHQQSRKEGGRLPASTRGAHVVTADIQFGHTVARGTQARFHMAALQQEARMSA